MILACGDGNRQLRRLKWRRWNTSRAIATGYVMANDCVPFCYTGTFRRYRTTVVAWRPRGGKGRFYQYTRMRYRYQGRWYSHRLNTRYGGWH